MNNRDYKNFIAGQIYHIYNRGNNKDKIVFDEADYRALLFRIGLALGFEQKELSHPLLSMPHSRIRIANVDKNDFKLHAFSIMPNHYHILIEQLKDISISKLIAKIFTSYAKYLNIKYHRVGHIFQDRFKAVLIESNEQLMWTSAYIHTNSVKDKIVKHPDQYKWSSYNDYMSDRKLLITDTELLLSIFENRKNFEKQTAGFDMSKADFDTFDTTWD